MNRRILAGASFWALPAHPRTTDTQRRRQHLEKRLTACIIISDKVNSNLKFSNDPGAGTGIVIICVHYHQQMTIRPYAKRRSVRSPNSCYEASSEWPDRNKIRRRARVPNVISLSLLRRRLASLTHPSSKNSEDHEQNIHGHRNAE